MKTEFQDYFARVSATLEKMNISSLERMVDLIMECRENGHTIYIFGNGGSAATASHIAGDFLKGISYELEKRFKVICLSDNLAGLSAISNDLSYEEVFIEPLKTFLSPGDLVIGISGSGNSANVIKAVQYARSKGNFTIGLCGYKGGKLRELSDLAVHVPIDDMEITEDIHLMIFHAVKQKIILNIKGTSFSMGENYDKRVK